MRNQKKFVTELTELLERAKIDKHAKYLTAKQVEIVYGIPRKTVLNRSNLPVRHKLFVPSSIFKGGRQKYFERKVMDRMFQVVEVSK
jgi:hypothetical protein